MRWIRLLLAVAFVVTACNGPADEPPTPTSPAGPTTQSPSPTASGPRLADGTPLPAGCVGGAGPTDTVAFVAGDRAWAMDPREGDVACLFPVEDPGPFAWGPQGDRVLLDDFEIRGVSGDAPDLPAIDEPITAFDWGHPLGLAVVYADDRGIPGKRFLPEGNVIRLPALPAGRYLQIAYHPSGLALAFVVETDDGQEIWFSTNEGLNPERLVFSERGTTFTSLAFAPNGRALWWTAQHEGYPALHVMKLAVRSGFGTPWRGEEGTAAGGLRLASSGPLMAVTEGAECEEHRALVVSKRSSTVALPDEDRPTEALGWLDRTTLLVAAGGCGDPLDLYAVDGLGLADPVALVLEVDLAAARTQVVDPPRIVPEPEGEPPQGGVG